MMLSTALLASVLAMFRADAAHTGVYHSAAPKLQSVQWRFRGEKPFISSPVVYRNAVYVGGEDGRVYALRVSNGTPIWHYGTQGAVSSSPAAWNGKVFFASTDGSVYAVDAANGTLRWRFRTAGEHRFEARGVHGIKPKDQLMADPYDLFISSPVIANGELYIGSGDRYVYALDAASGALLWKFKTGDVVHSTPAVANGLVYVGSWDRYFYALDAKTGAVRWKFITGDDQATHNQIGIQGSAAVANGLVYFGCRDSHLYALDARSGALRWSHDEHGSWVIASPALYGGNVYFTTSDEHVFFALDAATGAERFRRRYATFAYSSPSIAGGVAYFGTFDGQLYAIDAISGNVLTIFESDGAKKYRSAHLDAKGNFDLDSFYPNFTIDGVNAGLARIFTLGSIVGAPVIANGVLYVSSAEGILYAIR